MVSLVAQMVKNLPAVWETRVWSLGQEDPLEKGMATHSSVLAWRIPWIEEPGRLQFMGLQRVGHDWALSLQEIYLPNRLLGMNRVSSSRPIAFIVNMWFDPCSGLLIGKDSDAGRDCGQEEKGTTEDEMAGWHHWLDGRESHWTPGVGDGQGGLACCNSWGHKESDTTERLIWSDLIWPPAVVSEFYHQSSRGVK